MAKIKHMVGLKVIDGFKGVIDYYYYMGVPCARKWPRKPITSRIPSVQAQWPIFSNAASLWTNLSPEMKAWYEEMAEPTNLTGKDLFFRGYISGTLRFYVPVDELEGS